MKETGPDAVPPDFRSSFDERIRERFSPAPDPPLKIMPSSRYQLRIDSMVSSTERMKHAETCCGALVPTLNQTGELKEKIWFINICVNSCSKISASTSVAKYPFSLPDFVYESTTRSITCFSDHSRFSYPTAPRKYFVVTMVDAFTDHESGNSTPCCSKTTSPVRQFV
ncbi:unannotated protein [freshwater metagenome]|uniref:Unannotated protein n=1 Tax=freshwater metagenome TaxID=449393 RepID=A0A6J6LN61_9ZZZZ